MSCGFACLVDSPPAAIRTLAPDHIGPIMPLYNLVLGTEAGMYRYETFTSALSKSEK